MEKGDKMREFIDKTEEKSGTPLNRDYLMALQGFDAVSTITREDGTIVETNALGQTKTTRFDDDNEQIIETFVGEKTITKTTTFHASGLVTEVVS